MKNKIIQLYILSYAYHIKIHLKTKGLHKINTFAWTKKDTLPPVSPKKIYLHGLPSDHSCPDTVASERTSFQWPVWMPWATNGKLGGKQLKSPQGLVPKAQLLLLTAAGFCSNSRCFSVYFSNVRWILWKTSTYMYTYAYLEHMLCTDKGLTVKMLRDQINVFSKTSTGNGFSSGAEWARGIWFSSASIRNKSSMRFSWKSSRPNKKRLVLRMIHMGVSLNGGTPKTPQSDHF